MKSIILIALLLMASAIGAQDIKIIETDTVFQGTEYKSDTTWMNTIPSKWVIDTIITTYDSVFQIYQFIKYDIKIDMGDGWYTYDSDQAMFYLGEYRRHFQKAGKE